MIVRRAVSQTWNGRSTTLDHVRARWTVLTIRDQLSSSQNVLWIRIICECDATDRVARHRLHGDGDQQLDTNIANRTDRVKANPLEWCPSHSMFQCQNAEGFRFRLNVGNEFVSWARFKPPRSPASWPTPLHINPSPYHSRPSIKSFY